MTYLMFWFEFHTIASYTAIRDFVSSVREQKDVTKILVTAPKSDYIKIQALPHHKHSSLHYRTKWLILCRESLSLFWESYEA